MAHRRLGRLQRDRNRQLAVGVGELMGRATFRKSSWRTGAWVGSNDTAMDNSESAPPL